MKYVNLSNHAFGWTRIATNPFKTSFSGSNNSPIACIINNCFGILYVTSTGNPGTSQGAFLVLFDRNGNVCTYSTPDFVNGAFNIIMGQPWAVQISGNTIQWSLSNNPTIFTWKIPNVFQPGTNYRVPYGSLNILNSCNKGTFQRTIFLSQQNYIAYEFIEAFGESDNYYASIYNTQGNYMTGGYIGNSPTDIFYQISLSLPPFTSTDDVYIRNGFTFFSSMGDVSGIYQNIGILQPYLNGDITKLNCGSATPSVYVSGNNQSTIFPYRDWNCPSMNNGSLAIPCGITDVYGQFVLIDYPNLHVVSQNYFIDLPSPNNYNTINIGYVTKQNAWFCHEATDFAENGGNVYINTNVIDLTPYGPPPVTSRSEFSGLVNYHRVISPTGQYQA